MLQARPVLFANDLTFALIRLPPNYHPPLLQSFPISSFDVPRCLRRRLKYEILCLDNAGPCYFVRLLLLVLEDHITTVDRNVLTLSILRCCRISYRQHMPLFYYNVNVEGIKKGGVMGNHQGEETDLRHCKDQHSVATTELLFDSIVIFRKRYLLFSSYTRNRSSQHRPVHSKLSISGQKLP